MHEFSIEQERDAEVPAIRFAVKVVAAARRQEIVGPHGGALKVTISQPPAGGAANRALCRLVAQTLGVPARQVQVIKGISSPWKTLRVEGITAHRAREGLLKPPRRER